jgi:cell wall-associated NlpC family hydrolase
MLSAGAVAPLFTASGAAGAHSALHAVDSGYSLDFTVKLDELIGDLLHGERGDPHREANVPHHLWYAHHQRHHLGSWGPGARRFLPLAGLDQQPLEWRRERVLAAAARFVGYGYQHHHIPDWDPPAHWPWKHTCVGHNGKGVDCSNFTSFVYNQAFGIHMSSGIGQQAHEHSATAGPHQHAAIHRIALPAAYEARQEVLRTGDLLYILGREGGHVTHVVMWVGHVGRAPSGVPLILDSHGGDVIDDQGRPIPCGIHLRPFRPSSWYDRCASHAHRVFGHPSS